MPGHGYPANEDAEAAEPADDQPTAIATVRVEAAESTAVTRVHLEAAEPAALATCVLEEAPAETGAKARAFDTV